MKGVEAMEILKKAGAYQQGHFKLSSGLHSGAYLQCARVLENPVVAELFCKNLAGIFREYEPDVVIGPAMGGIILAYELARALGARALFTERDDEGKMTLRRGFVVVPDNRVLIAEDVLTTGRSVREVIELLKKDSIVPVGIASIVDRSTAALDFGGIKYKSLIKLNVPAFAENECLLCKEGLKLTKPGSRK